MSTLRSVVVRSQSNERSEAEANGAIPPATLVELESDGRVVINSIVTGVVPINVAVENDLKGGAIDDDYVDGDRVQYDQFQSGDEILVLLADGQDITKGDRLEATTGGQVVVLASAVALFLALETLDVSDSVTTPTADRRILVQVL